MVNQNPLLGADVVKNIPAHSFISGFACGMDPILEGIGAVAFGTAGAALVIRDYAHCEHGRHS